MQWGQQAAHCKTTRHDKTMTMCLTFLCCISADYAAKLEELEKSLLSRPVMASGYESSDMPDVSLKVKIMVVNVM